MNGWMDGWLDGWMDGWIIQKEGQAGCGVYRLAYSLTSVLRGG